MIEGRARDRVVLITGASSGIGRATARALARDGSQLVLASRSLQALEEVRGECEAEGAEVALVPTDVGNGAAVDSLFETAVARFGRVDAVVHSAAVVAYGRFDEVPAEVFDQVQSTNFLGTANVARTALRLFTEQQQGSLVVVGSLLGKISTPLLSSYVSGKWAVHALVRALQIEARGTPGIGVSLVSPGGVDTPIYVQSGSYTGRVGQPPPPVDAPEKVARAVVRAIDRPRRESSVGLANPLMVTGFRLLPGVFDFLAGPMMTWLALSSERVDANSGNVFAPAPGREALRSHPTRHRLRNAGALASAAAPMAVVMGVLFRRRGRA